jgi:hypothetical protein
VAGKQQERIQSAVAAMATLAPSIPTSIYLSRSNFIAVARETIESHLLTPEVALICDSVTQRYIQYWEGLNSLDDDGLIHLLQDGYLTITSLTHGGQAIPLRYLPGLPDGCIVPRNEVQNSSTSPSKKASQLPTHVYIVTGWHSLSGHCADIISVHVDKDRANAAAGRVTGGHIEQMVLDARVPMPGTEVV